MYLRDGYWAVETCIDDYMINYRVNDVSSEVYLVPLQCKMICKALGHEDAWICFESRLNNSNDAPSDLQKWFEYTKNIGIKDVTFEDFKSHRIKPGEEHHDLISYRSQGIGPQTGTSYPILHFRLCDFESMNDVL